MIRLLILVISFCLTTKLSWGQTIELSTEIEGKEIIIHNNSDYDSENKPTSFNLLIKKPCNEVTTCIVDLYRIMEDNETGAQTKHYFKTIILTKHNAIEIADNYKWKNLIDITDLFESDKAIFITTSAFIFDIYYSSKYLVSIKNKSDCVNEIIQVNLNP